MATFDHTSQLQKLKELSEQSQRRWETMDRNFDKLFKLLSILNPNINNTAAIIGFSESTSRFGYSTISIGDLEVVESEEAKSVSICIDEEDDSLESELIPPFFFLENEDAIQFSSYSHSSISRSSNHEETLVPKITSNHIDSTQRGVDKFSNSKPICESKFDTVKYEKAYSTNLEVSHLIHDFKVLFNSKLLGSNILDKTTDAIVLKLLYKHGYPFQLFFMNTSGSILFETADNGYGSKIFAGWIYNR
ncbi:hypothetical protein MKX03_029742, partial [Papaver bracteatum]